MAEIGAYILDILPTPDHIQTTGTMFVALLLSIVLFLGRSRIAAWDKHIDQCRDQATERGRMDQRVISLGTSVAEIRSNMDWLGDCVIRMGAQMKLQLPERPRRGE